MSNVKRTKSKHKMFVEDVKDLAEELGHYPYLYEICEHLGGTATSNTILIKRSMPWYPEKLMISPTLHKLMSNYRPGITIKGLAIECGVAYSSVAKMLDQLQAQGMDLNKRIMPPYERTPYQKPQSTGVLDVYMYVTDGIGEGQRCKIESITNCYNVLLDDGRRVTKEGWQLRDVKAHEKLVKLGKI